MKNEDVTEMTISELHDWIATAYHLPCKDNGDNEACHSVKLVGELSHLSTREIGTLEAMAKGLLDHMHAVDHMFHELVDCQ